MRRTAPAAPNRSGITSKPSTANRSAPAPERAACAGGVEPSRRVERNMETVNAGEKLTCEDADHHRDSETKEGDDEALLVHIHTIL